MVTVGHSHTAVITRRGMLFVTGLNTRGELGLGPQTVGEVGGPGAGRQIACSPHRGLHAVQHPCLPSSAGLATGPQPHLTASARLHLTPAAAAPRAHLPDAQAQPAHRVHRGDELPACSRPACVAAHGHPQASTPLVCAQLRRAPANTAHTLHTPSVPAVRQQPHPGHLGSRYAVGVRAERQGAAPPWRPVCCALCSAWQLACVGCVAGMARHGARR